MLACCALLLLSLSHHFLLSTLQRKEHTILLTNKVMMVCLISTYILHFFTSLYHKMFTIMLPGTVSYLLSSWEIALSSYKCGLNTVLPIWDTLPLSKPLIVHVFCYFRCQFTSLFTQRRSVKKNDFGARVLGLRCRSVSI